MLYFLNKMNRVQKNLLPFVSLCMGQENASKLFMNASIFAILRL